MTEAGSVVPDPLDRLARERALLREHVRSVLAPLAPRERTFETLRSDAESWRQAALREGDARAVQITHRMPAALLEIVADGRADLAAIVREVRAELDDASEPQPPAHSVGAA